MGDPKKMLASKSLMELDDPGLSEDEDDDRAPDTARPEYDTDKFALHVESAQERMTAPPEATFEMLRDSCKAQIVNEAPLDEEQILRPSSRKYKLTPAR
jgi:hypothetical protein